MERNLHSLQKSSAFLRRIFFVLLVIATAFLLWMAAAWIFGLFCTSGQMQAFETSYGGWSISAGPFVMQIQGGYFAPNAQLETVAKTAYSVESGMDLIAGACQWHRRTLLPLKAAVICAGSAHCYVLGLSCLNLEGPFYSVCWPVGSGRFSLADCLCLLYLPG